MKPLSVIILVLLSSIFSLALPEKKVLPFKYGAFFDGGTTYIQDLRVKPNKNLSLCYDGRNRSETYKKFYTGGTHPTQKNSRLAKPEEIEEAFNIILASMEQFFGSSIYKEIIKIKTTKELLDFPSKHPEFSADSFSNAKFVYHFIQNHRANNKEMHNKSQ